MFKTFAVFALVALFFVGYASAQAIDCEYCNKVTNATDCTNTSDTPNAAKLIQAFREELSSHILQASEEGADVDACVTLLFTKFCFHITSDDWGNFFSNVTVSITIDGITVWSATTTLPELMGENGLCLDDNTIIEILLLIPSLHDDIVALLKLLVATGCEPHGLFSLCLYFDPCDGYSSGDPSCGCFTLDFQLLYWSDYCVLKEDAFLGCVGNATQTIEPWGAKPMNTFAGL